MGPRSRGMSRTRVVTEGAVTPERRSAAKKRPIQGVRACDQERSSKAAVSLGTPATMTSQCSTLMAFCQCLYELENHSSAFTALGGWSGFRAYICGQLDLLYIAVDETEDQEKEAPVFLLEYVFDATLAYWRQCEAWLEHATGTVETSPLSLVSVRAFWVFLRDILEMLAQQVEQIMPTGVVTSILRWAPALVRALGQSKEPSDARSGFALRGALQALGLTLVRAIQRAPDAVARQACTATAKVIVRMLWPSEEAAVWVSVEWGLDRLQAVLDGMAAGSSSITGTRTGLLVLMREIERGLGTALELVRARAFVGTNTVSLEAIQGTMQRAHCLVHDLQQRIVADESEPDELVESTPRKKETVSATCLGSSGTREEVSAPGFAQVGEQVAASSMGSCQNTTNAMDSTATVEVVTWSYLENAVQILRTKPAADWEKRVEALVFIEEQARRLSRTDLVEFLRQSSLRYALADQIHDLRSQVVRQACATSATLARALGDAVRGDPESGARASAITHRDRHHCRHCRERPRCPPLCREACSTGTIRDFLVSKSGGS
ncbi:hypothetical protein F1559_000656 [Cyanidiococcus yangmingshanensis]|uniref:Uncharacterized protein n=1 Tax=Cyanidiococcus yangmingshanensis TaxID=2690220 RepID=A0A7J7IEK3_9RHOD|nr:hypothetical protein F1559_000656 [Cyanidiococcus yangmingshanensis]